MTNYLINDVRAIPLKKISDQRGDMTVVSNLDLPYKIKRVFSISSKDSLRGEHAHIKCNQFLVCIKGSLTLVINDSFSNKKIYLDSSSDGILIPYGIWSHQEYHSDETLINVYCDREYEENDYIRNFEEFKLFKSK